MASLIIFVTCNGAIGKVEEEESCEESEFRQTRTYLTSLDRWTTWASWKSWTFWTSVLDSILKMAKSTMSNQKIMQKEVAKGLIIVQVHSHCYWRKKWGGHKLPGATWGEEFDSVLWGTLLLWGGGQCEASPHVGWAHGILKTQHQILVARRQIGSRHGHCQASHYVG